MRYLQSSTWRFSRWKWLHNVVRKKLWLLNYVYCLAYPLFSYPRNLSIVDNRAVAMACLVCTSPKGLGGSDGLAIWVNLKVCLLSGGFDGLLSLNVYSTSHPFLQLDGWRTLVKDVPKEIFVVIFSFLLNWFIINLKRFYSKSDKVIILGLFFISMLGHLCDTRTISFMSVCEVLLVTFNLLDICGTYSNAA